MSTWNMLVSTEMCCEYRIDSIFWKLVPRKVNILVYRKKIPQTGWLKQQKCIVSLFWRQEDQAEGWDHGMNRASVSWNHSPSLTGGHLPSSSLFLSPLYTQIPGLLCVKLPPLIRIAKDGEALYRQQKQDQELTVAQIMKSLLPNSDLNWRR